MKECNIVRYYVMFLTGKAGFSEKNPDNQNKQTKEKAVQNPTKVN